MSRSRSGFRRRLVVATALCTVLAACAGGGSADPGQTDAGGSNGGAGTAGGQTGGATEGPDGGQEATEPAPDEVLEVSFGASALPSSIGLLAAIIQDQELDADHGLEMTFSEFAPDQAEQAILTGQVDTGFFAVVALANVQAEGQDVVFLRPLQANHGAVVVRDDSPYESLEDLRGETIATLTPVSGIYTSMQVLAAQLGLDWERDFELISGPPPALVAFIETGDVEAIVHFEPTVSRLLSTGDYRVILTPTEAWEQDTGSPLFMLGVAARQSWVDDNPEAARRLVAMFDELLAMIDGDPELLREYQEELGLDDEAMDIAVERMSDIYITESAEESEDNVRQILETSLELGVITQMPEPIFADLES